MRKIILEMIYSKLEKKESQLDKINAIALYPTEDLLWDGNVVPDEHYQNEHSL